MNVFSSSIVRAKRASAGSVKPRRVSRLRVLAAVYAVGMLASSSWVNAAEPSAAYTWRNVKIVAGGFIPGIVFSPAQAGLAYVRTDIGGFYRWDAQAKKWIPLTDWVDPGHGNYLGGESIAPDPVDANKVYAAAGMYSGGAAAIMRSKDQGRTFEVTPVPIHMGGNENGRGVGERLSVDPNNTSILYFGSRYDGLWKSTDAAVTWQKVDSFPLKGAGKVPSDWRHQSCGIAFVVFDPRSGASTGSKRIYAGIADNVDGGALYRSTDGGATWEAVAGLPRGLVAHQGAVDTDGSFYITLGDGPGPNEVKDGAVYKMNIATGKWTDISPAKPTSERGFGFAGLSLDRQHPGTLVVTTTDRWNGGDDVFRTTDGGKNWKPVGPTQQLDWSLSPYLKWGMAKPREGWWMDAVAIDPFDSDHVVYGTGATMYGTHDMTGLDGGKPTHWSVEADGIEETAAICLISPSAGAHLISGLGDVGGFVHGDFDVSPPQGMMVNPLCGNTDSLDFAEAKPSIIVRVGDKGGAISTDGGENWKPFNKQPGEGQGSALAVSTDATRIIWANSHEGVFVSGDQGDSWQPVKGLQSGASIIADRVNPLKFYAINNQTVYVSSDGGASFAAAAGNVAKGRIIATPGTEGNLWMAGRDRGLFHSTDGGKTFERVPTVVSARHIATGKAAPGHDEVALYLAGDIGGRESIYRSDDSGRNWVRLPDDQHQFGWLADAIAGDPRVYGRVYLGTNGRGVIYGDPAETK